MHGRKPWSSKYPVDSDPLTESLDVDAYIAATQLPESAGSAHAWEIRKRDSDERVVLPTVNKSSSASTHERGNLSAALRVVEKVAPNSHIRIFCRLENAVNGLRGDRVLVENHDIIDEYREIIATKKLSVEVVFCGQDDLARTKIINALLELARLCLKASRE